MKRIISAIHLIAVFSLAGVFLPSANAERRDEVSFLRGPYNNAFFYRHNESFRYSAAFHYYHGKQHDVLELTPLSRNVEIDQWFNGDVTAFTIAKRAKTEPTMELFAPYTARMAWKTFRAIDWTHMHHEQTYDIMSDKRIAWDKKKEWTDRAVNYYLHKNKVARSCAPLDVTMRRAGVMMKPYFTYYRNYYPETNNFAYVAHWWHPIIYESMMIGGNRDGQEKAVNQTNQTMIQQVFKERPTRMLLSREIMPRYSRLSPESANIFDNLHMLHGIVYDILAYEGWSDTQKQEEIYRVIDAMSYQPDDEKLARKFRTPHPDMDPRVYYDWMKGTEGEMSRIMTEMLEEMMPMMMPQGMSGPMRKEMMAQFKMKLTPGMEPGEKPGSLMDALKAVMPDMKMSPGSMVPGKSDKMMRDMMLKGWEDKYGNMPDIEPISMRKEPELTPMPLQ